MAEFIVGTTAALLTAAKSAVASDVIKLSAGTYAGVDLLRLNPSGAVTITSTNPTRRPAVFADLDVRYSSNSIAPRFLDAFDPNFEDRRR